MKTHLLLSGLLLAAANCLYAQSAPFQIQLTPLEVPGVGGLQSYAFAQHDGKWVVFGGRLDGLHRRQPFASFDVAGHNTALQVIDPDKGQQWKASNASLPAAIREQLSATNAQFHQTGNTLYVVGGYGYSATAGDHVTHNKLTAIDVAGLVKAIQNGTPLTPYFRQVTDDRFAVTGGHLFKIYDTYYLVGGQLFQGRYNPMGPNNGPGFVQKYTEQVRRFRLQDDGGRLNVTHLTAWTDADQLHRRDYNVVPHIAPNGQEALVAYSGVFQKTVDLPYLNAVLVDSTGYRPIPNFSQYYNHYHCPVLPLYDASTRTMHTVFFGGIAQFYDSLGTTVQDNNVPFVRTIARVSQTPDGRMAEYVLPIKMPSLLGAGAWLIPNETVPTFANGVFRLDAFAADTVVVGYMYGGISSSAPNIFWTNEGTLSAASSRIFKVLLIKNKTTSTHTLNPHSTNGLKMQIFPNPNSGVLGIKFTLARTDEPAHLLITSANGQTVWQEALKDLFVGENVVTRKLDTLMAGQPYYVTLRVGQNHATVMAVAEKD